MTNTPHTPTNPVQSWWQVTVNDQVDYTGHVLAVDADDAEDVARDLVAAGGDLRGDRGELSVTHIDRMVQSVPAPEYGRGPVRRFLDLSTAHLPENVFNRLPSYDGVSAHPTPYGCLMHVPANPDEHAADYPAELGDLPAAVLVVQRYARERGCDYVLFDRDADKVDGLPTWEW